MSLDTVPVVERQMQLMVVCSSNGWGHCFNAACDATVLVADWNITLAKHLIQTHYQGLTARTPVTTTHHQTRQVAHTVVQHPPQVASTWQHDELTMLLSMQEYMRAGLLHSQRAQAYLEQRRLLYRWTERLIFPLSSPSGNGYIGRSLWGWKAGGMQHVFNGTLPVRPYHPTLFFGTIKADSWHGPGQLGRRQENYKQFHTTLPGTKEVHVLALPISANIAEGMLHPPDIPKPKEEQTSQADLTRFVLGNWDEDTPHLRSFLGHLHAMRVIFLHRHEHPNLVEVWASQLWRQGLARDLITPLEALGIKAWKLSGDLTLWSHLISEGVRSGWLRWYDG